MELPREKLRQEYLDEIKVIEANIKDIANGEAPQELYDYSQNKLNKLAEKFQYDEDLGVERYKLYELQALLYYFQNMDDYALDFIQQAIDTKGHTYKRAEQLINQIESAPTLAANQNDVVDFEDSLTKAEKRRMLIGVDGWLAWYVIGLFIGTGITIFNFFNGGISLTSSEIDTMNQYRTGLGDTIQTLITFENIALIIYISLLISSIVLILKRKKLAKSIAITSLVFGSVYTIADYTIASSIFSSANLLQYVENEMSNTAQYAIRSTIAAVVWIPYFLISKRVKATLTK